MLKAIEKKVFQGQKDYEHLYFKLCDGNHKEKNMSKKNHMLKSFQSSPVKKLAYKSVCKCL